MLDKSTTVLCSFNDTIFIIKKLALIASCYEKMSTISRARIVNVFSISYKKSRKLEKLDYYP